jgi:hypothetical protein
MSAFLDASGNVQQLPITVEMYRAAADANMTLPQFINAQHPTDHERYGSAFNQILASEGIFVRPNRELGIRATTMDEILNGKRGVQAASVVKDAVPTSRILFPAVTLQAVEDKLVANLTMTANAFDELVGYEESINQERYEQPVINFDKPEAGRSQGIGQLAQPASMMTITVSDKAYRIPTWSLGMEISDQALKASTLDFVAMSLARQAAIERNERAQNYVLALLNGDVDNGEAALALDNSTSFDAAATGGVMTHEAWMKYLMKNGTKRTITHIVTDINMALKVEKRTGKPVITQDDSNTSRIDTQFAIMNPTWAKNPKVFLVDQSSWPANTMMGLDKNWAIRRVRNLSAEYNAIEAYVMRRSTALRFDFGEHVNRMYPEAFAGYFQL